MDKTNYPLLSIVAIVAITAVVAMFLSARVSPGMAAYTEETEAENTVFAAPLTGMVVTEQPAPRTANPYDFSGDGELNAADAETLARVIDRLQFCPQGTQCDVNGDDFVDIGDLGALNAMLIQAMPAPEQLPQVAQRAPAEDHSLSVGTFGAIA